MWPTSFYPDVGRTASSGPWTSEIVGLKNDQNRWKLLSFTGCFQADPESESRSHLDICDLVEGGGEVLDHVRAEWLDVLNLDELKHLLGKGNYKNITTEKSWIKIVQFQTVGSFSESYLKNGGVEKVVAIVVWDERINHRWEEIALQIQSEDKTGATYYGKKLFQQVKMTHIETRPWWCICCRTRPLGRWSFS